jgi:hypothetical protein
MVGKVDLRDRQVEPLPDVLARAIMEAEDRQYTTEPPDIWENLDPVQRGSFQNMAQDVLGTLTRAGYKVVPSTMS